MSINKVEIEQDPKFENGDTYCEDTDMFLGRLTEGLDDPLKTIPAQLTVYFDGYFYTFKMDSRIKREDMENAED